MYMKRMLVLLMVFALILGCAASAENNTNDKTVVVASVSRPTGMFFTDLFGYNTADIDVRLLLHGLSTVSYDNNMIFGINDDVVEKMEALNHGNGGKTYTLTLKEGLKFSDGSDILAKDFAFSVLLLSSNAMNTLVPSNGAYCWIEGYNDYHSGAKKELSGLRIIDELTLEIEVESDYLPYFYEMLYLDITPYPISELAPKCEVIDRGNGAFIKGGDAGSMNVEMLMETVLDPETGYLTYPDVVSGPYTLLSYDKAIGNAQFKANPYYPANSNDNPIERIDFIHTTYTEALEKLADGKIDILNKATDGLFIDEALKIGNVNSVNYERQGYGFLAFACEDEVTGSNNVRKAVAYALDKQQMVESFLNGYGNVVYSYYGNGTWVAKKANIPGNIEKYEFSLENAIQLLEADGWTLNKDGQEYSDEEAGVRYKTLDDGTLLPLVIRYACTESNNAAEWVNQNLGPILMDLGVGFETEYVTYDKLLDSYYRKEDRAFNLMFLASNFSFAYDPYQTFSDTFEGNGVKNPYGVYDQELFELALEMHETDPRNVAEFVSIWERFAVRYAEILPTIPIYSNTYYDFVSSDIEGYAPDANVSWARAILDASVR